MSKHNGGGTAEQTEQVREVIRVVDAARTAQRSRGVDAASRTKKSPRSRGRRRAEVVSKSPTVVGPTSGKAPVLSPGTKLVRVFKGKRHVVTTMEKGFEWNGTFYKSLSAVATAISGQHCSGPAFFGLRAKKDAAK